MTDRYFGEGGDNGDDGLSYANRKLTFANLASGIVAGDTIYICAAAAGVTWTMTEQINIVGGSAGNVTTYKVYPGHYVLMDVSTSGESAAIQGSSDSYFRIEPGDGFLELGDTNDWEPVWPDGDGFGYSARMQVYFISCTHFELVGTGTGNFDTTDSNFLIHGGGGWVGNYIDDGCTDYVVSGIDWSRHGTNNTGTNPDNPEADAGDLSLFAGLRNVIEFCTFQYGGHINARFHGCSQIVRNNDFSGDWTGVTENADAGRGAPIERSGNRCCGVYSGVHGDGDEELIPYGPVMMENNIMRSAGSAGDDHNNCASEINAQWMIIRFNYVWDGCDALFKSSSFPDFLDSGVGNQKIYNNTGYGNGRIIDLRTLDIRDDVLVRVDMINNIFDQMAGSYYGVAAVKHMLRRATGEDTEGFANGWKGGRYEANIFRMASTAPEGSNVTIEFRDFGGAVENYTVLTVDNAYPSNWTSDNVQGTSPTYLGNPASGARTKNTFTPNGGIETGTAKPHAYANGSGALSTTLVVDAGQNKMFFDGWSIDGEEADWIKIGSANPVQISSCHSNGTNITLVHSRTWSDNDEVYLCLTTDGVNFTIVEDIGAGQTAGEVVPTPVTDPIHSSKVMVLR